MEQQHRTVSIRDAQICDVPAMNALNRKSLPENYPLDQWELVVRHMHGKSVVAYVDDTNDLVGYVLVLFYGNDNASIASIAVDSEYRGQGIGVRLMEETMKRLQNVQNVSLNVRISNVIAQKLYKGFSFKKVKLEPKYYADGEDAYLMIRKLT